MIHGGYKLLWERFCLDTRFFFKVRPINPWNNCSRGVVETPLLEVLKMQLDKVLDNLI